ncbi:hypothetical protein CICLE_v10023673mg [Citrus x clementina]|uniref:Aminotransferase-like plant mobile domain-containing protein n=1 Tax=Citrus clementina TaxID=85681 RepID=V4TTH7_CITCL|nr:hypothetical protein CICLE_v10023673mg [Citrus x clementina]
MEDPLTLLHNGARFDQTNSIQSPSHEKSSRRGKKSGGRNNTIDEADVNQTENLKWIVKETLSYDYSSNTKLKGYGIPPNTEIFMNSWAVQRDPKFWNNSEEFIRERFARWEKGLPGISFATVESAYVLPNLLCWFDWKLPDDARCKDLDMSDVFVLVLRKKIPLRLVPVMPA